MTSRKLPDWIDYYLKYTEKSESPASFNLWTAIGAIAAVLQRKCWLKWEGVLYPNMYIVLVAPAGKARKGTALDKGRELLELLGIEMVPEATTREALIRRIKGSTLSFIIGDKTTQHHSITAFSGELTVLLGYQNQSFMADLCDWFDCRSLWRYDTKDKKLQDHIDNMWFNLIGATTPESLMASLPQEAVGGGLSSRIIFVYESKKGKPVHIPANVNTTLWEKHDDYGSDTKLIEMRTALKEELGRIHMLRGEFLTTGEFGSEWIKFKDYHENNPLFENTPLSPYDARRQTHILKLCMILSASRTDEMIITETDLARSINIISKAEKRMLHTFKGVGGSPIAALQANLLRIILTEKSVLFSKVMSIPNIFYNADQKTVLEAISVLMAQRVVEIVYLDEDGKKTHKNNKVDFSINYIGGKNE